jgi:hypothetical protein
MSKLITLSDDGATATVAEATISDAVTTVFSTTKVVTGMLGLSQKVLLGVAGNIVMNKRHSGAFLAFKAQ